MSAASWATTLADASVEPWTLDPEETDLGIEEGFIGQDVGLPDDLLFVSHKKRARDLATHISAASSLSIAPASGALEEAIGRFPHLARLHLPRTIGSIAGAYAYDDGNRRVLEGVDALRHQVIGHMSRHVTWRTDRIESIPSTAVDSSDSFLIQASDIAVGFARKALEDQGLPGICLGFDTVYFEGLRLTLTEAEEHERRVRFHFASASVR